MRGAAQNAFLVFVSITLSIYASAVNCEVSFKSGYEIVPVPPVAGYGLCQCQSEVFRDVWSVPHNSSCSTCSVNTTTYIVESPKIPAEDVFDFEETLPSPLVQQLFAQVPVFAPVSQRVRNLRCRKHSLEFVEAVRKFKMWALKMHDSTAKLPSGLLNGNVNQFGDFDQCLSVSTRLKKDNLSGKYCLAFLDVRLKSGTSGVLEDVRELIHSYDAIRSNFDDPGHRVPRLSIISWAFCIPSSCGAQDLQDYLVESFEPYNNSSELTLSVRVHPKMCYVQDTQPLSTASKATIGFFLAVVGISLIGTILHTTGRGDSRNDGKLVGVVKAFSLKKNLDVLLRTDQSPEDVTSIHGIRAINALALIIFHKSAALQFNPYVNRTAMQENLSGAWSIIGRTSSIYTDSFILISGLLTARALIGELDRRGRVGLWSRLVTRYIRFTPNLLAVILFCTYVMSHIGSGPQWSLVVDHHSDLCRANMWRNFLYIQNYFGFETMCLTHTHQLGIDMQLFLVSPLFAYLLWKNTRLGVGILTLVGVGSTLLRYIVTYQRKLSTVVYFGISVSQLFDTSDYSYILPSHRATVYLIGVGLGFALVRVKSLRLSQSQVLTGWVVATCCAVIAMCGPVSMAQRGYQYDAHQAAVYNALSPIVWSVFVCWAIVACHYGHGGHAADFLNWKGFAIFTRLAYAVYLTQFPVFFYNVGSTRAPGYYRPHLLFEVAEVGVILLASLVLTLLFDLPSQGVKKVLWPGERRSVTAPKEQKPYVQERNDADESEDMQQRLSPKG